MRWIWAALPFLLLPVSNCQGERLMVLAIGQVMPGESPIPMWFDADPLIDYVLVPTDIDILGGQRVAGEHVMEDAWRRYVRIYFPKTRDDLVEGFEFLVFPDGYLRPFSPGQIEGMRFAVENGLGSFVTMGGDLSGPLEKSHPGWKSSRMHDVLPVELRDEMIKDGSAFYIEVVKQDPAVLSMFLPLNIERVKGGNGFSTLFTRPGATVWAKLHIGSYGSARTRDWLVSMKIGSGGVSWAVADDLDHFWWEAAEPSGKKLGMDVFINILLYSTGRSLPEDILVVHLLRERYWLFNQRRLLLLGLLDFVDKFGANTRELEDDIDTLDGLQEDSFDSYRSQDYDTALMRIEEALAEADSIGEEAVDLKERALFWVYLTEWSAVSATLLISGIVIHALLIQRVLYRDVGITRSAR